MQTSTNNACRRPILVSTVLMVLAACSARVHAQATPPACGWVAKQIVAGALLPQDLAEIPKTVTCFWEVAPQFKHQIIGTSLRAQAALQKSSSTLQSGASTGANGTTSAVSKPNTPLVSLASEYGGITSSTSNQTMTLQTTLDGIPSALVGHGIVADCWSSVVVIPHCFGEKDLQLLNRFGFGVTANTSTPSQNISGTASAPQGSAQQASLQNVGSTSPTFSGASAKVTILKGTYKLPDKGPPGQATADAQAALITAFQGPDKPGDPTSTPPILQANVWKNYADWQSCINKRFTKTNLHTQAQIDDYFNRYYKQIVGIIFDGSPADCSDSAPSLSSLSDPGSLAGEEAQKKLVAAVTTYMASASIFEAQLGQMLRAAASPALSFEYDFNKPVNQPTTSTLKLVGSKSFGSKICGNKKNTDSSTAVNRFTGTINISGNLYNSAPSGVPGTGAFRDFQAGTELDTAFCTSTLNLVGSFLGNSTVGFTYYYQDQVSPSILKVTPGTPLPGISIVGLASSTSSVFASRGPINFVQLKYGLGTGKNVKFPIAVSWSNRTDLITHSLWSAQFGVSYDFSSLLGSSSSTSQAGAGAGSK